MELVNFQIGSDGVSLKYQGQDFDLHNNFNFDSIHYDLRLRQLDIRWLRSPEKWARSVSIAGLKIVFEQVEFLKIKERDPEYPFTEDDCLSNLSFHSPDLRSEFDSISFATSTSDDLTFYFQSEWGFKVNAKTAELVPLTGYNT